MNHFDILGVDRSATITEVKSAYRKLAMKYHPDLNPDGEEQFKKISSSYDWVLKNINPVPNHQWDHDRTTYDVIYRVLETPGLDGVYYVSVPYDKIDVETKVYFMLGSVEFRVTLIPGTKLPYTIRTKDLPQYGSLVIHFSTGWDK